MIALEFTAFAVAVERLRWPPLRGRPVAIASPLSPRAPLLAVSDEAVSAGLTSGMAVSAARRLCPGVQILPPDAATCDAIAADIARALGALSPVVEPSARGRFFVDATGLTPRRDGLGPIIDLGLRARRDIVERIGLEGTVGVAINKLVSGIAAEEARRREPLRDVLPGWEARFLAPLPTPRLPGVGERTEGRLLQDLNVRRVGHLAVIELPVLTRVFGQPARLLHEKARGIDWAPVEPGSGRPRDVVETLALGVDTNDARVLEAAVRQLAERAGMRLRGSSRTTQRLALHARHADDADSRAARALPAPTASDHALATHAAALLAKVLERRVRVRTLTLTCGALAAAAAQLDLFAEAGERVTPAAGDALPAASRLARLQDAADAIRARFGSEALRPAEALWAAAARRGAA